MNRLNGLDLVERVPEELWAEICSIVQEAVTKIILKKEKWKKAKWLSEEILKQLLKEEKQKAKEKEIYHWMHSSKNTKER